MRPVFKSGLLLGMSGAGGETVYQQYDVRGDGNCFYRSLFNAALYHKDPTVFERLLGCFGLTKASLNSRAANAGAAATAIKAAEKYAEAEEKYATAKARYNNLVAKAAAKGTKSRAQLPVPKSVSPVSPVVKAAEDVFAMAVREMLVSAVDGGIFEGMGAAQKEALRAELMAKPNKEERNAGLAKLDSDKYSLPEIFVDAALLKAADPESGYQWDQLVSNASIQMQEEILGHELTEEMFEDLEREGYQQFAAAGIEGGIALFKDIFKRVIIRDTTFASQMDIEMIKFILLGCDFRLIIPNPDNLENPPPMPDRFGGMQTIFVREVGEHYNFFAPVGRVPAHIKPARNTRQYSTNKNKAHALAVFEAESKAAAAAAAKLKANAEAAAAKAKAAEEAKAAKAKAAEEAKAAKAKAAEEAKAAKAKVPAATTRRATNVAARARERATRRKNNATAAAAAPAKPVIRRAKPVSYGVPNRGSNSNNERLQAGIAASLAMLKKGQNKKEVPRITNNSSNNEK